MCTKHEDDQRIDVFATGVRDIPLGTAAPKRSRRGRHRADGVATRAQQRYCSSKRPETSICQRRRFNMPSCEMLDSNTKTSLLPWREENAHGRNGFDGDVDCIGSPEPTLTRDRLCRWYERLRCTRIVGLRSMLRGAVSLIACA